MPVSLSSKKSLFKQESGKFKFGNTKNYRSGASLHMSIASRVGNAINSEEFIENIMNRDVDK